MSGSVPDARYDRPGPHVALMDPDGWNDQPHWQLNHGYYGVVQADGLARWSVEAAEGFGSVGDQQALKQIDQHCSAISHIVAHHGGCGHIGIRLRVVADNGKLSVSSFDSFLPLGVVHADGTYSTQEPVDRRIEPYTGLEYR